MALESMVARQMMSLKNDGAIITELMVTDAMWGVICREVTLVSVV